MKVGDKVRVIGEWSGHEFDIGDIATCRKIEDDDQHWFECDGEFWYMADDEYEPIPTTRFQIGQRYTQANGREVTCIAMRDDGGMFAVSSTDSTAAYAWDKDGKYLSCLPCHQSAYQIIFPPVIETVRIPFHTDHGDVYLSYQTKDGVPDWASAEVEE